MKSSSSKRNRPSTFDLIPSHFCTFKCTEARVTRTVVTKNAVPERAYCLWLLVWRDGGNSPVWLYNPGTYTTDRYKAVSTADELAGQFIPVGALRTLAIYDGPVDNAPFALPGNVTHRSVA